jgi:E3 ubiquitin-protein ligase HUWE1
MGGNMLISAGILPILLSSLELKPRSTSTLAENLVFSHRLKNLAKMLVTLDNTLYGFESTLSIFVGANGVSLLVEKIDSLTKFLLGYKDSFRSEDLLVSFGISPLEDGKYRGFILLTIDLVSFTPWLRAQMKLILHLMQNSGSADGMRNLIDSSLPKSLSLMFENSVLFGQIGAYSLAINIMSTFIHNEPTSLAVLQEMEVTKKFLISSLGPIHCNVEVVSALPNAFGAICLNPAGLKAFETHYPITNYLELFARESNFDIMIESDIPNLAGTAMDEFMRHNPQLKDRVMESILQMCTKLVNDGRSARIVDTDGSKLLSYQMSTTDIDFSAFEKTESCGSKFIDSCCRFLEGLFQNSTHLKKFIEIGGFSLILQILQYENTPFAFISSNTYTSLCSVMRSFVDANLADTVEALSKLCIEILDQINISGGAKWLGISGESMDLSLRDFELNRLVLLRTLVKLFSDLYCTLWLSHNRSVNAILKAFNGNNVLERLMLLGQKLQPVRKFVESVIPKDWYLKDGTNNPEELELQQKKLNIDQKFFEGSLKEITKWNSSMILYLVTDFPEEIFNTLGNVQRTLCTRRMADVEIRRNIYALVDGVSLALSRMIKFEEPDELEILYAAYFTKRLLIESRNGGSSVETIQLRSFFPYFGALKDLLDSARKLNNRSGHEATKLILETFGTLTNQKKFYGSGFTENLIASAEDFGVKFDPRRLFIQTRLSVLRCILPIWNDDLKGCDTANVGEVLVILTQIMDSKNESPNDLPNPRPFIPDLTPRITPDNASIEVLIEMGFPRLAAVRALTLCRNNVVNAADFLLNNPAFVARMNESSEGASNPAPIAVSEVGLVEDIEMESESESEDEGDEDDEIMVETQEEEELNDQIAAQVAEDEDSVDSEFMSDGIAEGPSESPRVRNTEQNSLANEFTEIQELNELRSDHSYQILRKVLNNISIFDDSLLLKLKDLVAAIAKTDILVAVVPLMDKIRQIDPTEKNHHKDLTLYLGLFSLLLVDQTHQVKILNSDVFKVDIFINFLENCQIVESWSLPVLLALESYFGAQQSYQPVSLKISSGQLIDIPEPALPNISVDIQLQVMRHLIRLLELDDMDENALTSIYRLLTRITRTHSLANEFITSNGLRAMYKVKNLARFPFQHSLMMILLRHVFETPKTLKNLMKFEIQSFLEDPRLRTTEMGTFLKGTSHALLRDPKSFIDVVEKCCELFRFEPTATKFDIKLSEEHTFPLECEKTDAQREVVKFFMSEIMASKDWPDSNDDEVLARNHILRCSYLQGLTEILVLFSSSKSELMTSTTKKLKTGNQKVSKNPFLHFIITEIITKRYISSVAGRKDQTEAEKFQAKEGSWGLALLTSLCTVRSKFCEPLVDIDLETIQCAVLDCVLKCFKETSIFPSRELKFARFTALGELCNRILVTQQRIDAQDKVGNDGPFLKLAKLFIEKGFVDVFANIVGELDLEKDDSSIVLLCILRPMELISSAGITLAKNDTLPVNQTPGKTKRSNLSLDHAFQELEEEEVFPDQMDLSEMYRNSALGMLEPGSDLDSEMSGSSEEEDEDEDEDDEESMSETEDEMEIMVPQPFHGASGPPTESDMDDESQQLSEGNESEEEMEYVLEDDQSIEWEDIGSEVSNSGQEHAYLPNQQQTRDDISEGSNDLNRSSGYIGAEEILSINADMETDLERFRQSIMASTPHGVNNSHANSALRAGNNLGDGRTDHDELPWTRGPLSRSATPHDYLHPLLRDRNTQEGPEIARLAAGYSNSYDEDTPINYFQRIFSRQGFISNRIIARPLRRPGFPEPRKNVPWISESLNVQINNLHLFVLLLTDERWKQESKTIYGNLAVGESLKYLNEVLNSLIPREMEKYEKRIELEKQEKIREETEAKMRQEEEAKRKAIDSENLAEPRIGDSENVPSASDIPSDPERQIIMVGGSAVDITGSSIFT